MSDMNRDDIEAVLAVRQEKGAEIEPALVDSMARRIEETVRRRYEAEVAQRDRADKASSSGQGARVAVAITSLVLAIPLTAITAEITGLAGMLVAWIGIVLVNMAMAMRRPPQQ
ncbi:hypothetical protein [Tessaracoccus oleiagri]|nr:hypothetical protein [Tessaracoccus oleiagri]